MLLKSNLNKFCVQNSLENGKKTRKNKRHVKIIIKKKIITIYLCMDTNERNLIVIYNNEMKMCLFKILAENK